MLLEPSAPTIPISNGSDHLVLDGLCPDGLGNVGRGKAGNRKAGNFDAGPSKVLDGQLQLLNANLAAGGVALRLERRGERQCPERRHGVARATERALQSHESEHGWCRERAADEVAPRGYESRGRGSACR